MAKKLLIESPPVSSEEESSSSEEEASSDEECKLKKGKSESNSHTPTKAKEEAGEETEDGDSEDEESDENNDEESDENNERQNSANKTHEEQDGSSDSEEEPDEESKEDSDVEGSSDSEEEESKEDIKVEVPKPSEDSKEDSKRGANDREKKPNGLKSEVKAEDEDTKKDFFARLWSFEDEIILLNSMLEFRLKEGKDVDSSSLESFCEFLKGGLSFTDKPELRQVSGKIKALKKKYTGAAVAHFTKEHDLKMKDIASQVWVSDVKSKPLKRKCSLLEEEVSRIFGSERKFDFVVDVEEAEALEEELREQKRMKVELDLKRMDLITETFKLIMEGIQKSYGF